MRPNNTHQRDKPLTQIESARPVFFKAADAPWHVSVEEVAEAAEEKIGHDRIAGAMRKGGLWRVYGKTEEDRANLLTGGGKIYIVRDEGEEATSQVAYEIPLYSKNPIGNTDAQGNDIPSTRLTIDGFFFSVSSQDIKKSLEKIDGVKLNSEIYFDRERKADGTISRWANGKRFCFINTPTVPLPKTLSVGQWRANLWYRGMPKPPVVCWICGEEGHRKWECKGGQKKTEAHDNRSDFDSDSDKDATMRSRSTGYNAWGLGPKNTLPGDEIPKGVGVGLGDPFVPQGSSTPVANATSERGNDNKVTESTGGPKGPINPVNDNTHEKGKENNEIEIRHEIVGQVDQEIVQEFTMVGQGDGSPAKPQKSSNPVKTMVVSILDEIIENIVDTYDHLSEESEPEADISAADDSFDNEDKSECKDKSSLIPCPDINSKSVSKKQIRKKKRGQQRVQTTITEIFGSKRKNVNVDPPSPENADNPPELKKLSVATPINSKGGTSKGTVEGGRSIHSEQL